MRRHLLHQKKLYGTATVGTKGQVVIPADARKELDIKAGDRLYVVGSVENGYLGLLKEEALESMMQHLTAQIENFHRLRHQKEQK